LGWAPVRFVDDLTRSQWLFGRTIKQELDHLLFRVCWEAFEIVLGEVIADIIQQSLRDVLRYYASDYRDTGASDGVYGITGHSATCDVQEIHLRDDLMAGQQLVNRDMAWT